MIAFLAMIVIGVALSYLFPEPPSNLSAKEVMALNVLRARAGDKPFHTRQAANEFVNALDSDRRLKVLRAISQLTK